MPSDCRSGLLYQHRKLRNAGKIRTNSPAFSASVARLKLHGPDPQRLNHNRRCRCYRLQSYKEDAKKLAERTTIKLEPWGDKLTAKIDKPTFLFNQSVSVSLEVTVPNNTGLELTTHNGRVEITNITGQLNATTHNGKVTAEQVSGTIELHTHNGSVICREVSGDTQLKSHNGNIKVYYSQAAPSVCDISLITYNGGIELTTPSNFSGEVEASTHNGSINTDLPITVKGKVSRRKLTGTIGTGQGKLHLETHNGSIRLR